MDYNWDETEEFDDAAEIEEKEEQEEVEHDLDYWAEEAESSDAIAEDERITAELEDAYIAVVESEIEKEEDPAGYDDGSPEDELDASAPISFSTLRQEIAEVAVDRTSKAARTEDDFKVVIGEMDRLDKNRRRRERYHEVLRGDVPLEYKTTYDGLIFPLYLSDPKQRLLFRGQFWDILCDCPHEMHELTGNTFLSKMVKDLKMDHKELLYYLSLHLYSTTRLAKIRGQSDRNIRKVRDTYTRKLQKKLYRHLIQRKNDGGVLTLREKEFLFLYEEALEHQSKTGAKVKRENKSLKRKKATTDNVSDG